VGLFDEAFSPGYFEDDDYCIRTRRAGYRLTLCLDAFVHHAHEGTFRSMDRGTIGQVIARNKCYFESKWGVTWTGSEGQYAYIDEAVRKPAIALAGTA
jgi:GT2 family glycosyltransferase